ncbi:hypothetical protein [Paraburkholderia youngii]|uniref:hypothetical protein n=1 Tax=Paraburkholderia youngii TaxID=2782701 RepID=UPI003D194F39
MAAPKVRKPNAAERQAEMIAGLVAAGTQVIGMTLEAMNRRAIRRPVVAHVDGQGSEHPCVPAPETVSGNQPALAVAPSKAGHKVKA